MFSTLNEVKEFIKANASNGLQNVILCHLSNSNSDSERMVAEIQKVANKANVYIAERGSVVELRNKNEGPF